MNKTISIARRITNVVLGVLFLLIMSWIAVARLLRMTRKEIVGFVVFVVLIVGLVALSRRFRAVEHAIPVVFVALISFWAWILISLIPMLVFFKVSEFIVFARSVRFQVVPLVVWGLILVLAISLIATEKSRRRLFQLLRDAGNLAPVVYSFNVLMIAVNFFAVATYVLVSNGFKTGIAAANSGEKLFSDLLNFYTWHFLDAIPLLRVNQTLGWDPPLTYKAGTAGLILLLFKIAVIVPVIAAFTGYWKYKDDRIRLEDLVLAPEKGSESGLHVTFFGVSTLLFDDGETAFMIDGFFTRPGMLRTLLCRIKPNPKLIRQYLKVAKIKKLEAVIVAHSHYDHALDAPYVARLTKARLIGSESTGRIARALKRKPNPIEVISGGERKKVGNFEITFIQSQHSPITLLKRFQIDRVLLAGEVDDQFKSPARWSHYKEGGSYSLLVEHAGKKILVQSSAGYVSGALNGREADIVFLGIGALGKQSDEYRADYWREVVAAVGARRVIPIHWDDFSRPLSRPLVPPSPLSDNVQQSLAFLLARGKKAKVDVKILTALEKIDPFAGMKRYQGQPKRRSS